MAITKTEVSEKIEELLFEKISDWLGDRAH